MHSGLHASMQRLLLKGGSADQPLSSRQPPPTSKLYAEAAVGVPSCTPTVVYNKSPQHTQRLERGLPHGHHKPQGPSNTGPPGHRCPHKAQQHGTPRPSLSTTRTRTSWKQGQAGNKEQDKGRTHPHRYHKTPCVHTIAVRYMPAQARPICCRKKGWHWQQIATDCHDDTSSNYCIVP
jgi:hypothetical protein